ncbi:MAG: hypothetical protein ACKV0T_03525, partial [Planctomycetales bacterium]
MAAGLARFKSTLVYEAEAPAEQVLVDLQEIREFDQQSEARLRIWKILTLVSVLIVGPGSCLGVSQALGPRYSQGIFFTCLTVGGIGLITGIVLWVRGARLDLANRRYELCAELMRLLGRDMAKDAPLSVALDLARPNERRKKSDVGQVRDWKVTYFQDPWLRLRGKFADGTTFQITMIEKFQARSKWTRSRSG